MSGGEELWAPTPQHAAATNIARFADHVRVSVGVDAGQDYETLYRWSVDHLDEFWREVWNFHGLRDIFGDPGIALADGSMPGSSWFPGVSVNFAEFLVGRGEESATALIGVGEEGESRRFTWGELRRQVNAIAASLRDRGVVPGDTVVGYVPNCIEAVVAFLATAWIGATWASVGQDLAARAVIDRFAQLEPKVLFTADGYSFGGRRHDRLEDVQLIRDGLRSLHSVILIPRLEQDIAVPEGAVEWDDVLRTDTRTEPLRVPFDHPLWVLFSSGTTGIPKGLVHGHGGILVEMLKQMSLHWDLDASDRVFWFTSPSWVMWNLQLSTLCLGGSIVCYDGSPTWPDARRLWQIAADEGVTYLGFSPGYLQASETQELRPSEEFDLSKLRALGSTGSPLSPFLHRWAFERVGRIPLWSISGGTDIAGAFAGGAPTVPVVSGELSLRCLGVALEAWDADGGAVTDAVGEMVITRPMPSMPVRLWNDPDGAKYRSAYFDLFPNAWRQGDWVTVTGRGTVVIHGRSDSTLNRNGVRMGSADIYAALEQLPEVNDALVLGIEEPDGEYWMPLFVHLADGKSLSSSLVERIRSAIRASASPRHVPDDVIAVAAIPHTRTGKRLEIPLKRIFQGQPVDRVVNPNAVDDFETVLRFVTIAEKRAAARASRLEPHRG